MLVYTMKYALTAGIETHEVEPGPGDPKYVYTEERLSQQFVMGKTAFLTYAEAAVAAREMRNKKKISRKKQLCKLNEMTFPSKIP